MRFFQGYVSRSCGHGLIIALMDNTCFTQTWSYCQGRLLLYILKGFARAADPWGLDMFGVTLDPGPRPIRRVLFCV